MLEFIKESNAIEGIMRDPTTEEINAMDQFMEAVIIKKEDLIKFVSVYQPDAKFRNKMNVPSVRIGNHVPPMSGPDIEDRLDMILGNMLKHTPFRVHKAYEDLHPFTDGNGRSGRALWLWHCKVLYGTDGLKLIMDRGFLHSWYYQSLSNGR